MALNSTETHATSRQEKTFPSITLEEFVADLMRLSPKPLEQSAAKRSGPRPKRERKARKLRSAQ